MRGGALRLRQCRSLARPASQVAHVVGLVVTCAKSRGATPPAHLVPTSATSFSKRKQRAQDAPASPTTSPGGASTSSDRPLRPWELEPPAETDRTSPTPRSFESRGGSPIGGGSGSGSPKDARLIHPVRPPMVSVGGSLGELAAAAGGSTVRGPNGSSTASPSGGSDIATSQARDCDSDAMLSAARTLPEWLAAAVGRFHEAQVEQRDAWLLSPTNAVVDFSRVAAAPAVGASSSHDAPTFAASVPPPELAIAVRLTSLDIVLTPEQLGLINGFTSYLSSHQQYELWRRFRPAGRVRPTDSSSARRWWHALGMALKEEIGRRRPRFDWAMLLARRADRRRYV
ncbi:hypothetical protein OAO87_04540, partial [bacterium]|nr:hypothetical protein [bacterium]